jgi:hypothetical protein
VLLRLIHKSQVTVGGEDIDAREQPLGSTRPSYRTL